MPPIAALARDMLEQQESELAVHLGSLFSHRPYNAAPLIADIIPVYYEGNRTLEPEPIYRPLYYLEMYATGSEFARVSRIFILNACWHIEGCLKLLAEPLARDRAATGPLGPLVHALYRAEVIPRRLAEELLRFNKTIYVPAHHPSLSYDPHSDLEESTYVPLDAALTLVLMRRLSINLFSLLTSHGVKLPHEWKEIDDEWLRWRYEGDSGFLR